MTDVEAPLFSAAADGVLLEEFRALKDTDRYPNDPVLVWLARFLVGAGGGPNKDSPLFELCHLVYAVDLLTGRNNSHGRTLFFLGLQRVVPSTIRQHLDTLAIGPSISNVSIDKDSVHINYEGASFHVKFGRMPFLLALYEFLVSMEAFAFHQELSEIFENMTMGAEASLIRCIKDASNKISSRLRQYRRAHMIWAAHNEKFNRIFLFLKERGEGDHLIIDDVAILDFWTLHSQGKDFRGYKTVFDAFVMFQCALQTGRRSQAAEQSSVLGADFEAGEVDLSDHAYDLRAFGDWVSPLQVLDEDDLREIKFFKRESERRHLEQMMRYGPDAIRLLLAFLRLESFAPIQTGITNDLQVKRGRESIEKRIMCTDAVPYIELRRTYAKIFDHVRTLQKAALHGILKTQEQAKENILQFPEGRVSSAGEKIDVDIVAEEAGKAFQTMTRRGFENFTGNDDERGEAFEQAAGALVSIARVLQGVVDAMKKLDLEGAFDRDREIFSSQFSCIYGVEK